MPVIAKMSESSVISCQRSLWKQAGRKSDVATSHNRGTLFFWLQSRRIGQPRRVKVDGGDGGLVLQLLAAALAASYQQTARTNRLLV